jgi:hypothetical protein
MSRVIRARNGAGFWSTYVVETWARPVKLDRPRLVIPKRRPAVKGRTTYTTGNNGRPVSRLRAPILALLREYDETGLTAYDIADELGANGGHVLQVVMTLVAMGLVHWAGNVRVGQKSIRQWKLRDTKSVTVP